MRGLGRKTAIASILVLILLATLGAPDWALSLLVFLALGALTADYTRAVLSGGRSRSMIKGLLKADNTPVLCSGNSMAKLIYIGKLYTILRTINAGDEKAVEKTYLLPRGVVGELLEAIKTGDREKLVGLAERYRLEHSLTVYRDRRDIERAKTEVETICTQRG